MSDGRTKLTPEQVDEIRRRHKQGETNRAIAQDYPVTEAQIGHIVNERSWKKGPDDGVSSRVRT